MEKVESKKYDILFMDLLMPEMDGIETTIALRKKGYDMPIVALTAVESDEIKQSARNAGIVDYLVKPAKAEDIKELLLKTFSKSL